MTITRPLFNDTDVVDAIATYLGTSQEWSGAECLEVIAELIATVRPHPGDIDDEDYPDAFAAATGRSIREGYDMRRPDE